MANTVQILMDGLDFTPFVQYETVHVDNNVVMTSDTMDLTVAYNPDIDMVTNTESALIVPAIRPMCGQEIIWQNPNNVVVAPDGSSLPYREFAGVVVEVKESTDGLILIYAIHAKSYVHWLDRRLVTAWYNQDNPENIINGIVNQFTNGFTTYNVQTTSTTVIPQYFDYRKVSESIKSIADQLEYGWYVDYFKDVHFYAAETFTSPLPYNTLDVENDTTNYGDLEIIENGEQQCNKIFIKGFKTRTVNFLILTFPGDGQTVVWSTGYRVSSVPGDVQVQVYQSLSDYQGDTSFIGGGSPTAGTTMTLKKDIIDGAPEQESASNTAYIHYTQHLIRIPNYYGGGPVPSGHVVAVRFHYLRDMVYLAQDPGAQVATATIEGTSGVYESSVTDKSLTNSTMTAVQAKGQLLLMKYKFPQITGNFNTYFNATSASGWRAGQFFTLKSTRRFGGINKTMYVQRVLKSIVKNDSGGGLIAFYNIQFADTPYLV